MTEGFSIEALNSAHNRKGFSSGVEPLDRYFRELVTQDVKRRVSNCFVALDAAGAIAVIIPLRPRACRSRNYQLTKSNACRATRFCPPG